LKKYILFFVALTAAISVKAQSGYNYQEWGVGGDLSYERGYTNITKQFNHIAFNVNAIYNFNPYMPVEAEIQSGTLSGGGLSPTGGLDPSLDPYGRGYTNHYVAVVFHVDAQLGSAIDYSGSWILNIIKNFYVGTGFGLISNNNNSIRYSVNAPPYPDPGYYKFPGVDHNIDFMIPLRAGYEFKIFDDYNEPSMAIDIGYVHSFAFAEGLDGYDDPESKFKNDAIDQYRQVTIGFKYYFGRVVSYNKLIRDFRY
jgi:hypothetical protein